MTKQVFRFLAKNAEADYKELQRIAGHLGVDVDYLRYARYGQEAYIGLVEVMSKKAIVTITSKPELNGELGGKTTLTVLTPGESIGSTGMYLETAPQLSDVRNEFMQARAKLLTSGKEHLRFDWDAVNAEAKTEHEKRFNDWWYEQVTMLIEQAAEVER